MINKIIETFLMNVALQVASVLIVYIHAVKSCLYRLTVYVFVYIWMGIVHWRAIMEAFENVYTNKYGEQRSNQMTDRCVYVWNFLHYVDNK